MNDNLPTIEKIPLALEMVNEQFVYMPLGLGLVLPHSSATRYVPVFQRAFLRDPVWKVAGMSISSPLVPGGMMESYFAYELILVSIQKFLFQIRDAMVFQDGTCDSHCKDQWGYPFEEALKVAHKRWTNLVAEVQKIAPEKLTYVGKEASNEQNL